MATPFEKKEQHSTYVVPDSAGQAELERLTIQGRLLTSAMGGIFPEQADAGSFQRVLDIGCGPGGWVLEAAQAYPSMSLVGIDSSQRMIDYARAQAARLQIADRAEFQVMDALLMLQFPDNFFDLVNLRLGSSFLRTWDWPKMIGEMQRVTRPEGIIRVVESEFTPQNSPPALERLYEMLICGLYRSGHLFSQDGRGLISDMVRVLTQHGCKNVQTYIASRTMSGGTAEGQMFAEDMGYLFQSIRPFLSKWGCMVDGYDTIYQQALEEIHQPTLALSGSIFTFCGQKPEVP